MSSAKGRLEDGEAIKAAVLTLRANLAAQGVSVADPEIIVRRVVAAYLPVFNKIKARGKKWSSETLSLSEMAVGDELLISTLNPSAIHDRMRSARVRMNNSTAAWSTARDGQAIRVVRREDGSEKPTVVRSPMAKKMAEMQVNETHTFPATSARRSTSSYSDRARLAMGDPGARWTYQQTNKGMRCRRVA